MGVRVVLVYFFLDVLLNLAVALPDSHRCMIFTWLGDWCHSEPCHLRSQCITDRTLKQDCQPKREGLAYVCHVVIVDLCCSVYYET